jgi:hypothetical protein
MRTINVPSAVFRSIRSSILSCCQFQGGNPTPLLREAPNRTIAIGVEHPGLQGTPCTILAADEARRWSISRPEYVLLIGSEEYFVTVGDIGVFLSALQKTGDLELAVETLNESINFFN